MAACVPEKKAPFSVVKLDVLTHNKILFMLLQEEQGKKRGPEIATIVIDELADSGYLSFLGVDAELHSVEQLQKRGKNEEIYLVLQPCRIVIKTPEDDDPISELVHFGSVLILRKSLKVLPVNGVELSVVHIKFKDLERAAKLSELGLNEKCIETVFEIIDLLGFWAHRDAAENDSDHLVTHIYQVDDLLSEVSETEALRHLEKLQGNIIYIYFFISVLLDLKNSTPFMYNMIRNSLCSDPYDLIKITIALDLKVASMSDLLQTSTLACPKFLHALYEKLPEGKLSEEQYAELVKLASTLEQQEAVIWLQSLKE